MGAYTEECQTYYRGSNDRRYCFQAEESVAELSVEAQGQTLTQQVSPRWKKDAHDCRLPVGDSVVLALSGPGCPVPSGVAVQGTLFDTQGQPATGTVNFVSSDQHVACLVTGNAFACPAVSAYTNSYQVTWQVGSTRQQLDVLVEVDNCVRRVADGSLDVSKFICDGPPSRALGGAVKLPVGRTLSARAHVGTGPWSDCIVDLPIEVQGETYHNFACVSLTKTGGGTYSLELQDGKQTRLYDVEVIDDGCDPHFSSRVYDLTTREDR